MAIVRPCGRRLRAARPQAVPSGLAGGLPVGVQVVGRSLGEWALLAGPLTPATSPAVHDLATPPTHLAQSRPLQATRPLLVGEEAGQPLQPTADRGSLDGRGPAPDVEPADVGLPLPLEAHDGRQPFQPVIDPARCLLPTPMPSACADDAPEGRGAGLVGGGLT